MLRLIFLVFLVIGDAHLSQGEPPKFRSDYIYVAKISGWLKLNRVLTDWVDARARCQLEGADLASPSDDVMLRAMRSIIEQSPGVQCGVYTGIHAWFSPGDYTSIEGTPLSKMPVDFTNSKTCPRKVMYPCTVLLPSCTLETVDCNQLYPFMCYRKDKKIHNMCECGTIDSEYKYYEKTDRCYKFHLQPQTWPDAYKICQAEGGHLAVINSDEEAKVISSIFTHHPANNMLSRFKDSLLLGFKNLHGTWNTIHGQSLQEAGYPKWSPGQPDTSPHPDPHGKKEYCGSMFRTGLLDDIWCDVQFAFLCEKHLPEDNDNIEVPINNQMLNRKTRSVV